MLACSFRFKLTIFSSVNVIYAKKKDYDILGIKKNFFSNVSKLSKKQRLQSFSLKKKNMKNIFSEKNLDSFLQAKQLYLFKKASKDGKVSTAKNVVASKKGYLVNCKTIFSQYRRRLFVFSKISFYNSYFKFFHTKLMFVYKKQKINFSSLRKMSFNKYAKNIKFINYNKDLINNKYITSSYKSQVILVNNNLVYDLNKQRMFPFKFFLNPVKPNIYSSKTLLINTLLVNRLIGIFIKKGNRTLSEKQLFDSILSFKKKFYHSSFKLSFFLRYFILLLVLYAPKLTLRNRRKGSVVYKVPFFITPYQQHSIFLKWLKDSTFKRSESTHSVRFKKEILDLFDQNINSNTLKKHVELHSSVIKNRAFAHFRWI